MCPFGKSDLPTESRPSTVLPIPDESAISLSQATSRSLATQVRCSTELVRVNRFTIHAERPSPACRVDSAPDETGRTAPATTSLQRSTVGHECKCSTRRERVRFGCGLPMPPVGDRPRLATENREYSVCRFAPGKPLADKPCSSIRTIVRNPLGLSSSRR